MSGPIQPARISEVCVEDSMFEPQVDISTELSLTKWNGCSVSKN